MSAVEQVQQENEKLQNKITKLEKSNKEWQNKYYNLDAKYKKLEGRSVNKSELEYLRIANGRLIKENSELRRNERALEKLQNIERILKG